MSGKCEDEKYSCQKPAEICHTFCEKFSCFEFHMNREMNNEITKIEHKRSKLEKLEKRFMMQEMTLIISVLATTTCPIHQLTFCGRTLEISE